MDEKQIELERAAHRTVDRETEIIQAVCTVLMFVSVLFTVVYVGIDHPAAPVFAFGPTVVAIAFFVWRGRLRLNAQRATQGREAK